MVRPFIEHVVAAAPVVVHDWPPGRATARYPTSGPPAFRFGAYQLTSSRPSAAKMDPAVGANGSAAEGDTALVTAAWPGPAAFWATTLKV